MKLLRYGPLGSEKPAMLDSEGRMRDLSLICPDIAGNTLTATGIEGLRTLNPEELPIVEGNPRIGACVGRVGKFICVGLNYADHAAETGVDVPAEPILFMKATSAICGPDDGIMLPKDSTKTDWEVELGIVIGSEARNVSEEEAMNHVAGFCVINDLSERAFQFEGTGQWVKGKSADTFGPIGPWLVTPDEVADVHNLSMRLTVNDEVMQNGSTRTMVFQVPFLVSYISRFMSLQPGDVISTGTPPGVGLGMKPPRYLNAGDVVALDIEGLGAQRQIVHPWRKL